MKKAWYMYDTRDDGDIYIAYATLWTTEELAQAQADKENAKQRSYVDTRNAKRGHYNEEQERAKALLIENGFSPGSVFPNYARCYQEEYQDRYKVDSIEIYESDEESYA